MEQRTTPTHTVELDGEIYCSHEEAYVEKACCSGPDSDGLIQCGCQGMDSIICPDNNCTGIQDWEIEDLWERMA